MYVITTSHIRDAIIVLLDQKQGRLSFITDSFSIYASVLSDCTSCNLSKTNELDS